MLDCGFTSTAFLMDDGTLFLAGTVGMAEEEFEPRRAELSCLRQVDVNDSPVTHVSLSKDHGLVVVDSRVLAFGTKWLGVEGYDATEKPLVR